MKSRKLRFVFSKSLLILTTTLMGLTYSQASTSFGEITYSVGPVNLRIQSNVVQLHSIDAWLSCSVVKKHFNPRKYYQKHLVVELTPETSIQNGYTSNYSVRIGPGTLTVRHPLDQFDYCSYNLYSLGTLNQNNKVAWGTVGLAGARVTMSQKDLQTLLSNPFLSKDIESRFGDIEATTNQFGDLILSSVK